MEPQRFLRCLGQPALFAPTGEPIRFRTRKHLALLVYIAVEARSHRRDRLGELLWPKVSATEARHSLATALSILRPRLGLDALETSRDHVRLLPGRVALDLDRLQAGDVLGTEVTGPLEVAAFLDGFDIADSAEFTHWKDRQQARLLPVIKDALLVLMDRCRRTGDTRQIEQLADRMLALDDLSEEAIRAKMEARAFAGDRLTALEIFEAWKKKLAEELQAVPSDLVEGMAVRLRRRGWERTTSANIPNVPTDQWRGRPFVGRTAEYRVLYELWDGVRKGVPGHALILGDSGVGKTTLVQRLTTAAGLEGAAISRVQCYDLEQEIPYSTLSCLVIGLLDRSGVSATSPEALSELSRCIPEVRQRFPNIPVAIVTEGETARIRITEAFLEMLTAIAEEHPVILVLDDMHVADDVSLAVLHLVIRRSRDKPVMVLMIARPGELSTSSAQAARLREAASSLSSHELEVPPLGKSESQDMLRLLLDGHDRQPTLREQRALLRAASGYPMVLELLVEDWKASREQSLALGLEAMTADLKSEGSAHLEYRHILDRIIRSVDSTTHNVLNLAALLGSRLNDIGMYGLVDLTPGQTMTALSDLVDRRVLRDGAQGLEFINELVRAATYISVPITLRRILHGKIADRFIQEHVDGREGLGLAIAWHCTRAGRIDEATEYLFSGARDSIRVGALHSAECALTSAIPHLSTSHRGDAVFLLVEVLQEQGRWRDSLDVLNHGAQDLCPEAHIVFTIHAHHWLYGFSPTDAQEEIARLRTIIEGTGDAHLRLKAARIAASLNSGLRNTGIAKALLESLRSVTPPTQMDDMARLSDCKAQLLYHAFERSSALNELTRLGEQLSDKLLVNSTVASLHTGIGVLAICAGLYSEGKSSLLQANAVNRRLGNDSAAGTAAAQIAMCCYRLGEYHEALQWGREAYSVYSSLAFGGYLECQNARHLGLCYAMLGKTKETLALIEAFELRMPDSTQDWMKQDWYLSKADMLTYLGSADGALRAAQTAIGESQLLHDRGYAGPFARWVALTSMASKNEKQGRQNLERLMWDLDKFDALDQLEILCAFLLLGCASRTELIDLQNNVRARLQQFPVAQGEQLSSLGVLPASLSPPFPDSCRWPAHALRSGRFALHSASK